MAKMENRKQSDGDTWEMHQILECHVSTTNMFYFLNSLDLKQQISTLT
jgi:hypothetical protein